jgi:hypothetical protein
LLQWPSGEDGRAYQLRINENSCSFEPAGKNERIDGGKKPFSFTNFASTAKA